MDEKPTKANPTNGLTDPKTGRFAKGNKGGPGNPLARRVYELRTAMFSAVTAEDMAAIVSKAVEQARDGDRAARDFVCDRLLGKPKQSIEIEGQAALLKTFIGIDVSEV